MPPKTPSRRRSPALVVSDSDSERKPPTPTPSKSSSNGSFSAAGGGGGGGGGSASGDRSPESAVRVVVRFRPQNKKEIDEGGKVCVSFPSEDSIEVNDSKKTYDRVFDPSATQQQVFDYVAKPLVEDLLSGYNGTIFAYGQTSSGKTHTMEGPSIHDKDLAGVIPRTVRQIFFLVAEAPENVEFVIKVSYIEIYMEKIRDLLDIYHTKVNLPVREEKSRGVYIAGATEEYVTSAEELISIMGAGAKNRAVAATGMNQGSSRSHSVFIISVQQRNVNDSSTKTGMLYLVDLAGSEMVKKTHATGQVLNEAKTINKSLSALGQVINALTDDKKPHVPYRDSKLTRVLQNSLGGNSKTCLIVNCSPSSFNELETVSTLRFGSRAKRIQNKAVVNETRSVEELGALLIKAESAFDMQQTYIAALEKQLKAYRNKNRAAEPPRPPQVSNDGGEKEKGGDGTRSPPDRAPQDEESANAIRQLTKRNQELQQDLEEEKAEVNRREQVSNELRQVLAEKERLILEAANLFREAESVNAAREEAACSERADVEAELEAMRTLMQETSQRHQFNQDELTLKVEKLSGENARLAEELREITGDDLPEVTVTGNTSSTSSRPQVTRPRPSSLPSSSRKPSAAIPASDTSQDTTSVDSNIDGPMSETPPLSTETAVAQAGEVEVAVGAEVEKPGDPELTGGVAVSKESRGRSGREGGVNGKRLPPEGFVPAEEMEKFDFSALQSAGAPEEAMAMVADREERWRERESTMIAEQWKYMTRAQQLMAEREVRERQLECNQQNCEQLAQDLQNSERRREREQEQTAAASYPGGVELERLKRETILLQQRLAQLSEVHRRLLWKFGQVESERSESEKKVRNRDVLIKQLEQDYVAAVMKHKNQKEDYTRKLLVFRQEVAKLEQEAQRQKSMPTAQSHLERRAVRGGGGSHHAQEVKTLRGGAGRRPPDDAQPWGGLGYDVQSNTYASEQAAGRGSGSSKSSVQRTGDGTGDGADRRKSVGTPGKARGESFLERFLGSRVGSTAGTPLPPKVSSPKPTV